MKILAIVSAEYGKRHVENIQKHQPDHWLLHVWQAPTILPPVIDDPEDYLPQEFPQVDLILSFAENKGVAELLPDVARMTGAQAVIVAVDNETWLPRGLEGQLHGWLAEMGVACATPKPLCTLTESDYKVARSQREPYDSARISEFARYFGQPSLRVTVDPRTRAITAAEARTDSACGCARYVAQNLVGVSVEEAQAKAQLLHHHYPCLASMVKLDDYDHETLMMESGNMLSDSLRHQIAPYESPEG